MFRNFYLNTLRSKLIIFHQFLGWLDRFPLAINNLAQGLLNLINKIKHLRAMKNEGYAKLYNGSRREYELTDFSSWIKAEKIKDELYPLGLFTSLVHKLTHLKLAFISKKVIDFFDLITKGWKESQVWNLDYDLSYRLGHQLLELSEMAHGWPSGEDFPDFEDWREALILHGNNLIAYSERDSMTNPFVERAYSLKDDNDLIGYEKSMSDYKIAENEIVNKASEAYYFIAKYHTSLWD
jgi:hypothetical protein